MKRPPRIAERLLHRIVEKGEGEFIIGDIKELYLEKYRSSGPMSAGIWYWAQIILSTHQFVSHSIHSNIVMFLNYLKIALKVMKRQKFYSAINIFMLSSGLTCCLFIFLYIRYELSYDSYHRDSDRIYRIISTVTTATGTNTSGGTSHQLTPYVRETYHHAAHIARITPALSEYQVQSDARAFNEAAGDILYVDDAIFQILSINFIHGDATTALAEPGTIVITEHIAQKYFDVDNALDRTLTINGDDYKITGIVSDLPPAIRYFNSAC